MSHGSCAHCGRRFKTAKSRQIAERYSAVVADLRGIAPAAHLDPAVIDANARRIDEPSKQPWHTYNRDHGEG